MAGGFPCGFELSNANTIGTSTSTSTGTSILPSASANTKGSFVELIPATSYDTCWVVVDLLLYGGALRGCLVDIAIGASSSEKIIIDNIGAHTPSGATATGGASFGFPLTIPAGTRISARSQSSSASTPASDITLSMTLFDGAFTQLEGSGGVDSMGALTASSLGTSIDTGGTANTKGAWVQLTGSTARDYCGLFLHFDNQTETTSPLGVLSLIDIGIGAGGSEIVLLPDISFWQFITPPVPSFFPFVPVSIPAGTVVSARAQGHTNSTNRNIGVIAYGVYT